jgi:hypothetical protein
MSRAWIVDLLTSLVMASIVAALVLWAGGPVWAAIGFGWMIYLGHPLNAQRRHR